MSEELKITCQLCGGKTHLMKKHLAEHHPEVSVEEYAANYPDAPLISEYANKLLEEQRRVKAAKGAEVAEPTGMLRKPLHEVFGLGMIKSVLNNEGNPIMISILPRDEEFADLIPEIDEGHIWDIDGLKTMLMGLELKIPTYRWGHAGTGKTTGWEQVCARTNRPFLRVQHTINTEESHIVGQWIVKDGQTKFELGPLATAMKFGLVYCADEYDFGLPSILSVYQPVLEGKPLVIKEADHDNRIIKPHPNFRFVATGNTNGCGDETGLYQGTNIQNAANTFGMCSLRICLNSAQPTGRLPSAWISYFQCLPCVACSADRTERAAMRTTSGS